MGFGKKAFLGALELALRDQERAYTLLNIAYKQHMRYHKHEVHVEGVEHLDAHTAYFMSYVHTQHWRDFADLAYAMRRNSIPVPIATFGTNLTRTALGRAMLTPLGFAHERNGTLRTNNEFYDTVSDVLSSGRSVTIPTTKGLVKKGEFLLKRAPLGLWHKRYEARTGEEISFGDLTTKHPVVPVAINHNRLYGELIRAKRDTLPPNEKLPNFDHDLLLAPFNEPAVTTAIRIGEPITAQTHEEARERVNDFLARSYPVFAEDLAAYALHINDAVFFPSDVLGIEGHRAFGRHRRWLIGVRKRHGDAVYHAALQQRVGPLEAKLACIAPGASQHECTELLLAEATSK
jgi:hypothetical protein